MTCSRPCRLVPKLAPPRSLCFWDPMRGRQQGSHCEVSSQHYEPHGQKLEEGPGVVGSQNGGLVGQPLVLPWGALSWEGIQLPGQAAHTGVT